MYLVYTHSLQRLFREQPAFNFVIPRSPVRINELRDIIALLAVDVAAMVVPFYSGR